MAKKKGSSFRNYLKPRHTNIFAGIDDIWLTPKSIAMKKVRSIKDKKGNWTLVEKTTYVPKTVNNLIEAEILHGHIREGRYGK